MIIVFDELKDDFNGFLKSNALWITLALVGIILVTVALILIFARKNKKAAKPEIAEQSKWLEALGGKENIVSSDAFGSRLILVLKDKGLMNKEALKQLGVTNFIEMSEKITLLLEDKAELVKAELDK